MSSRVIGGFFLGSFLHGFSIFSRPRFASSSFLLGAWNGVPIEALGKSRDAKFVDADFESIGLFADPLMKTGWDPYGNHSLGFGGIVFWQVAGAERGQHLEDLRVLSGRLEGDSLFLVGEQLFNDSLGSHDLPEKRNPRWGDAEEFGRGIDDLATAEVFGEVGG
jgi:hypothetical protein